MMDTSTGIRAFHPTEPGQRIIRIDILRGLALFGVLLVNVFGYNASLFDFSGFYSTFTDPVNSTVFEMLTGFCADKFIFIFSFLFGMGFSIMYRKYQADEKHFFRIYFRRMLVLSLFGILHILLFWSGDILLSYSLMGLILLLIRKLRPGILLFLGIFFYFLPILHIALQNSFAFLPDALSSTADIGMKEVTAIYSEGSFSEIFRLRLEEFFAFRNINLFYYAPKVLGLFILGSLFLKFNILELISALKARFFVLALAFITTGTFLILYMEQISLFIMAESSPYFTATYMGLYEISNLFLGFGYMGVVLICSELAFTKTILSPLKYAGRMALSNYIMQSLIFTTIMYSYGFGMFGSYPPWQLLILAALVFCIQVVISRIWLKYFTFGPLEWIWRKGTYTS